MLALKIFLRVGLVGFFAYKFIDTYRKEKSNGVEGREAFLKAGNSALGGFRTAASALFLFGFLSDDISHHTIGQDPIGTDVSQSAVQTNIGLVNEIHNDVPTSNHDAFDTHDTVEVPSSNGWDLVASSVPWIVLAVGATFIAPEILPFMLGAL
jgi:hypothetical protein